MRRGYTRGSGIAMRVVGVSAKVRAYCSIDLDSHVSFIRKSLASGVSAEVIGRSLGVSGSRIRNYARRKNMIRPRHDSLYLSRRPGEGPIA